MSDAIRIEGSPYSATFVPRGEDDHESYATGVIQPPIDLIMAEGLIEAVVVGSVEIQPYARTTSRTVIDMTIRDSRRSHQERLDIMNDGLSEIIDGLNKIENGEIERA